VNLLDDLTYVGIVGTRRRDGSECYTAIKAAFLKIYVPEKTVVVSGGCPEGGDRFAEVIAAELGMPLDERWSDVPRRPGMKGQRIIIHWPDVDQFLHVPPRWRKTRANYARNSLIARDARDYLIASVAADRTGGTEDTIKKFVRYHKKEPIIV